MLNKIIKEQLAKVQIAPIGEINDDTKEIIIKKQVKAHLSLNKVFIIEINDKFMNMAKDSSYNVNYNNGNPPLEKYLKCQVLTLTSDNVKIIGVYYDIGNKRDTNRTWNGWLPLRDIKIVEEL